MTAIAEMRSNIPALAMDENELLPILMSSLYPGASEHSARMVIGYCRASNLDVMQKPVHIVPMWDREAGRMRDVVMPGVGLYRTQAARSGQMAGISEPEFGPDRTYTLDGVQITAPEWCRVTAKRRLPTGEIAEFTAVERWLENYAIKGGRERSTAPNAMWMKRPYGQLAKCAQAQALRMGFPEMTGAAPTAEEMEGKVYEGEIIDNDQPPRPSPPEYPQDQFDMNIDAWGEAIQAGKITADKVIAKVETKGVLTEAMKTKIRDFEITDAEVHDQ